MKVRIENNKNIQTMEQKDIDIYEILKDEEYGTELYTPKCGKVWHSGMANDKDSAKAIWTEDEELTIIGKLIDKNESEDTLTFGNQYEIETEKFVTDQAFDLRISVNKELREATENEVELFNKHYAIWKKEKEAKEHRAFKPFDKVLVRSGDNCKWLPALFIRDRGVGFESRHTALPIHSGEPASFAQCISYDGNEYLAFTSDPF